MAVVRPRHGDDDVPGGDDARDDDALSAARPGEHVTIVADEPDTETLYAEAAADRPGCCLLYTSPSPRD